MDTRTQRRSRRIFRVRRAVIALALSAITIGAGLAYANQASAKTIGYVDITVNGQDYNAKAHWGEAWNACTGKYPATRSIHYKNTHQAWDPNDPSTTWYEQDWACDDQP
jgi:hypothetical protein